MTKTEGSITVGAMGTTVTKYNLLFGAGAFIICLLILGLTTATALGLGLIVGTLNYQVLFRSALRSSKLEPGKARTFLVRRYFVRFILMLAAFGVIIFYLNAHPVPVMIGYTQTLIVATATIFRLSNRDIEPVIGNAGGPSPWWAYSL